MNIQSARSCRRRKSGRHSRAIAAPAGTIVFTTGFFDLIHVGHLQLLNFARSQGDKLVVGLNSDRSVRLLKGEDRPIHPASERARILAAMEPVDYVVIFDDAHAERIVRAVRPDVLVKGEDESGLADRMGTSECVRERS